MTGRGLVREIKRTGRKVRGLEKDLKEIRRSVK